MVSNINVTVGTTVDGTYEVGTSGNASQVADETTNRSDSDETAGTSETDQRGAGFGTGAALAGLDGAGYLLSRFPE